MNMQIGNMESIYSLAINEEAAIRERLEQIQIEMSDSPYLIQVSEFSKKRDVLRQELRNAEIKTENLMHEIDFSKNFAQEKYYG